MTGNMADYYGDVCAALADLLKYDEDTAEHLTDPNYWRSKNGRVTRIELMHDRHLINTINMLGRQGVQNALLLLKEKNELLRDTQLKMMGFGSTLTLRRYMKMVVEHAKREARAKEKPDGEVKEVDRSNTGDG